MEPQFITINSVKLNNNCPECYSREGLELTFKQKFKETSLYRSITKDTKKHLRCTVCNTDIFPVMWTEDIERVVAYQQKAFTPKPSSIKLKKTAWILFILFDLLIISAVLLATGVIKI